MTDKQAILVHACCASCSSYVLEHLAERYTVTAYFYNPNIHPRDEYDLRLAEMRRLCEGLGVPLVEGEYRSLRWWKEIDPYKRLPEKSERCWACYRMRFEETARKATELGISIFTTTLSVSPHKVYAQIVRIGEELARRRGLTFLPEDFKKHDGFKKSVERSRELALTRQDYCGCLLSRREARERRANEEPSEP
jgi:predicted adenine nucleotide alpha hydrolase (AANH) superfamily ATPase